ncbi:hypothetical protein FRC18_001475 [Serendipita sp. 400]|nr:hypothetical protein FRC18_001475 [Serendipita sp. 400]
MPSQDEIRSIGPQDTVIAVMGATGVGKSTFIALATGSDEATVGHNLRSCTEKVQPVRHTHNDRSFVFLDTPGFDDTKMSDVEVLANIAEWLTTTYRQGITLAGVLYLQRISDNKVTNTTMRNTQMFEMICGQGALQNVILVTTMWDHVDEETGRSREEQLRDQFWKSMVDSGSRVARFTHTHDSAWQIVNRLDGVRRPLRLQMEMVDQRKSLSQTSAGISLFKWLDKLMVELRALLKKLRTVLQGVSDPVATEEIKNDVVKTEKKLKRAVEQRQRLGQSKGSFADVVRGVGLSRSSSLNDGVIASSPTSIASSSSSTSLPSILEPARRWLVGKNILAHGVAAAEIAPVPFLKGVVSLSYRVVESIEAMNRTDRSLIALARSARKLCSVIQEQKSVQNLSGDVKHALQDLVEDLQEVQAVLKRMKSHGKVHKYILQQADEHLLAACNQSIHDAYNLFMLKCVIAIHQDIQQIRENQQVTIRSTSPFRRFGSATM